MESCGMSCIKYLLFIFNLIFALSGVALVAVGAIIKTNIGNYSMFLADNVKAPPILLIVIGVIVFIIAFFGCCGAIKESPCMLITFSVFLLVILILELAVGIVAFLSRDQLSDEISKILKKTFNSNNDTDKKEWDDMQQNLECCGLEGPKDYKQAAPPASCCKDNKSTCNFEDKDLYQDGCEDKLVKFLRNSVIIIAGVGIAIAFVELFGIIFACCLSSEIKKGERL